MSKVKIQSRDGELFDVPIDVIRLSNTIKTLLQDLIVEQPDEGPIPLPNVNAAILKKVIQWCEQHKDDLPPLEEDDNKEKRTDDISSWDADFLRVDQGTLFELILAANYLDIKGLLDVACKTVANMIKGKTPEEIRRTFNIKNDFTPQEEEQIRKENAWCEDPNEPRADGSGYALSLPYVPENQMSAEGIPKDSPYSIKVNNLSERIHKKNLVAAFQSYGEITDVYIPRDNERRKGFGYAFVRFCDLEAAERAIAGANGQIVKKRQMILEWSTKHPTVPLLATVHKLPEDVLKRIFEFLRWDSLARVGHVNRKWRKISLDVWNKFKSLTMYDRFSVRHKLSQLVEQHGRTLESICFERTKIGQLALSRVGRCCPNLKTVELLDVAVFKPRPSVDAAPDACLNYLREIFVQGMPRVKTLVLHKLDIAFFASPTAERRINRGLATDELLFLPHMRNVQRLMLSKVPLSNTVLNDLTRNLANTLTCLILKNNGNHLTAAQIYSGIRQLTNLLELTVDLDVLRLNANANLPFSRNNVMPTPEPIAQPFIAGLVETNTSLEFLCLMRATIRKEDLIQLVKSLPQLKFLFLLKCNTINGDAQGFTPPNIISSLKQRPLANANNPLLFFCDEQAGLGGEEITEFNAANRNHGDTVHLFVGGLEKFRCLTAAALTEQKALLKEATGRWSYATMLKGLELGVMFGENFSGWSMKNTRRRRFPGPQNA